MWTEQDDPESMRGDVAMDDADNNRKRGSLVVSDPKGSASSTPTVQPSNASLLRQNQDAPASSPSKQEPKRNKLSLLAPDNAMVKNLVLTINNDALLAGSHGESLHAQ